MNKKEFLEKLNKKLNILNKEEREDIIGEYKSTIEEKVKDGKTEEEAVKDFGDINDLVEEILKAYKINTEYTSEHKQADFDFKDTIKTCSKKLAEFTEDIMDNLKVNKEKITLEKTYEIILKVVAVLILLLLLKIPFMIMSGLCIGIFDIESIHLMPTFLIRLIFNILYIAVVIIIVMVLSKKYTDNVTYKNENIRDYVEKEYNDEKKETRNTQEQNSSIGLTIIKVLAIIIFLIPLLFTILGLVIAIVVLAYLTIKCLIFLGPLFIIIGLTTITSFLFDIVYSLTIRKKRLCIAPIISGVVFMAIGSIISFNSFLNLKYINEIPKNDYDLKENIEEKTIQSNMYFYSDNTNVTIEINDELEDNKVIIKTNYYEEFTSLNKLYNDGKTSPEITINLKELYNIVMKDLKNNEVYNYHKLFKTYTTVITNSNTSNKIKVVND